MTNEKGSPNNLPDLDPDSVQLIAPPDNLRRKAVLPGKGFAFERNAINRAEKALENLSEQFGDWMDQEVQTLTDARDDLKAKGIDDALLDELQYAAHDLRGQAATLGFPCAATLCESLCQLIDNIPDKKRIPQLIIDQHVDAVRAIVRENVTTEDNLTAITLIKKLRAVTQEFLDHEIEIAKRQDGAA